MKGDDLTDVYVRLAQQQPAVEDANAARVEGATTLRASLMGVASLNPDERAKALSVASRLKLHPDAVSAALRLGSPQKKADLTTDYDRIAREAPLVRQWLMERDNAAIGHDDTDGLVGLEKSLKPLSESRGWWGGLGAAGGAGITQVEQAGHWLNFLYGKGTPEDVGDAIAGLRREAAESAQRQPQFYRDYRRGLDEAEGVGVIPAFLSSPSGALYQTAEQLANSVPGLALGGVGAVAGSAVPVIGTLGGAAAGVGAGSALVEIGSWFEQALGARGVDLDDPAAIAAALRNDPELVEAARGEAQRKGLTIGVVEGISTLFGGHLIKGAAKGALSKAVAVGKELGEQAIGESAGEALSQAAAYKGDLARINVKDVLLEGLAGTGVSGGQITLGALARRVGVRAAPIVEASGKAVQVRQDASVAASAVESLASLKTAQRSPEAAKGLVREILAGSGVREVRVDRVTWDETLTAAGVSPADVAAELAPGGARAYAASAGTGEVALPAEEALVGLAGKPYAEALLPVIRFRDGAPTLEEAEADAETFRADFEAAVDETAAAEQETAKLTGEVEAIRAELAALEAANPGRVTLAQSEVPSPRGTRNEERGKIPENLSPESLRLAADVVEQASEGLAAAGAVDPLVVTTALTDALAPTLDALPAGSVDPQAIADTLLRATTDPAGLAADLRERADTADVQAKANDLRTRLAEAEAALEAHKASVTKPAPDVERIIDDMAARIVAAGRSQREALLGATLYGRALATLAARYGHDVNALAQRFQVRFNKAEAGDPTLGQGGDRGGLSFDADSRGKSMRVFDIDFYEKADHSTLAHELFHFFAEVLGDLAAEPDAPPALVADYKALLAAVGAESRETLTVEQHELIAKAGETYLATGKAPSPALERVFAAFARWLAKVYRDITGQLGIELTDETRAIFDRLLATDAEIDLVAAQTFAPMDLAAAAQGVFDEAEMAAWQEAQQAARDEAQAEVQRELMADLSTDRREARALAMGKYRLEAEELVNRRPEVRALAAFSAKGEPRISRASVEALYGRDHFVFKALEEAGALGTQNPVVDIAVAADRFGFASGDALARGMETATHKAAIIDRIARTRLAATHPELLTDSRLKATVRGALEGNERMKALLADLAALTKLAASEGKRADKATLSDKAGKAAAGVEDGLRRSARDSQPTLKSLRVEATAALRGRTLRQIRPAEFLASARRAGNRAVAHLFAKEYQLAAQTKRAEVVNHELHRLATSIQKQAAKDIKRLRYLASSKGMSAMLKAGGDHAAQAQALLERFDLRDITAPTAERRKSLAEYVKDEAAAGRPLAIPTELVSEALRTDWRSLTPEQLSALRSALDGIHHLATTENKRLAGAKGAAIDTAIADMAAAVAASRPRLAQHPGEDDLRQKLKAGFVSLIELNTRASDYAHLMDGGVDSGPVNVNLLRPINAASDTTSHNQREADIAHAALYTTILTDEQQKALDTKTDIGGGVSLTLDERMSVLSLMGTVTGRQRLGNTLTAEQQRAAITGLPSEAYALVRARWAMLDGFFEQEQRMMARISGQDVKPVERASFVVTDAAGNRVEMAGGYHPLAYKDAAAIPATNGDTLRAFVTGVAPSAQMQMGFLEERVDDFRGRPRLDRGVVSRHIHDIVHSLGMLEPVLDAQRMLGITGDNRAMKDAIVEHYGAAAYQALAQWLSRVATGGVASRSALEAGLAKLRNGAVQARLGFRAVIGVKQILGINKVMTAAGKGGVADTLAVMGEWFSSMESIRGLQEAQRAESQMMRERQHGSWSREIADLKNTLPGKLRTMENAFAFWMVAKGQGISDSIAYEVGKRRALREKPAGVTIEEWMPEVIARGEQMVRTTQGSGQAVDLSFATGGPPWVRLLTTFGTEMQLKFSQTRRSYAGLRSGDSFAHFLADMAILYTLPVIVSTLAAAAIRKATGNEEDKEHEQGAGETILRGVLAEGLDVYPLVREMGGLPKGFEYDGPPGIMVVANAYKVAQQVGQGEIDLAAWKAINLLGGTIVSYPAQAMNEYADAFNQIMDGDVPTALVGIR